VVLTIWTSAGPIILVSKITIERAGAAIEILLQSLRDSHGLALRLYSSDVSPEAAIFSIHLDENQPTRVAKAVIPADAFDDDSVAVNALSRIVPALTEFFTESKTASYQEITVRCLDGWRGEASSSCPPSHATAETALDDPLARKL
jgi:hypothetical protein